MSSLIRPIAVKGTYMQQVDYNNAVSFVINIVFEQPKKRG
jgi:hypothetical protein